MSREMKKVVVAMSGGVDSSVAALLLCEEGHEVTGLFMRTGSHAGAGRKTCCSVEDGRDARAVADLLGIPFYALDFEGDFKAIIDDYVGDLVVVEQGPDVGVVLRVNPVTGDRTIVSDAGTGAGEMFYWPIGIAIEASGDLVVTDLDFKVFRVDPVTGDRTIVSSQTKGTGPTLTFQPSTIAVESSGDIVVTTNAQVFRVRTPSGNRSILSGGGNGTGPGLGEEPPRRRRTEHRLPADLGTGAFPDGRPQGLPGIGVRVAGGAPR